MYKPVDDKTVGIHFDEASCSAAYVVSTKGKLQIKRLFELPLTQTDEAVKLLYNEPDSIELKKLIDQYLVVTGLPGSDVLVRRMRLKLTQEDDIEAAFEFQAEPQLPYAVDDAVLDKILIEKQDNGSSIVFLAAKKEQIQKQIDFCQSLKFDPEVITTEPVALANLLALCADPAEAEFAVHVGKNSTLCILVKDKKLIASHEVQAGWESLQEGLLEDKGTDLFGIDLETLSLESHPHFFAALEALQKGILWNYMALMKETKSKESPLLYVAGEGANLLHFPELLAADLGIRLGLFNIPSHSCSLQEFHKFSLPIGLALSAQNSTPLMINFRKKELVYATPWKRFLKHLYVFGASALGLAIALYAFGASYYHYKENGLKSKFLSLLTLSQKPFETFESQYEAKFAAERGGDTLFTINELDAAGISRRLDYLEKEVRSVPDNYPLFPQTPLVSDVLAWITTHPTLTCSPDAKEGDECPSFMIDIFQYSMVKRPELNKKNEKYQVKIDLEFSTSSPRLAREFHDALITPNDFIDPKGEIKWNATKGKYRTSFFLKDKTFYP